MAYTLTGARWFLLPERQPGGALLAEGEFKRRSVRQPEHTGRILRASCILKPEHREHAGIPVQRAGSHSPKAFPYKSGQPHAPLAAPPSQTLYEKKYTFFTKHLAIPPFIRYNTNRCDMIAVKREVAARYGRFSVERMSS